MFTRDGKFVARHEARHRRHDRRADHRRSRAGAGPRRSSASSSRTPGSRPTSPSRDAQDPPGDGAPAPVRPTSHRAGRSSDPTFQRRASTAHQLAIVIHRDHVRDVRRVARPALRRAALDTLRQRPRPRAPRPQQGARTQRWPAAPAPTAASSRDQLPRSHKQSPACQSRLADTPKRRISRATSTAASVEPGARRPPRRPHPSTFRPETIGRRLEPATLPAPSPASSRDADEIALTTGSVTGCSPQRTSRGRPPAPQSLWRRSSVRPITIRWISEVPSPISSSGASRYRRSISYSFE